MKGQNVLVVLGYWPLLTFIPDMKSPPITMDEITQESNILFDGNHLWVHGYLLSLSPIFQLYQDY